MQLKCIKYLTLQISNKNKWLNQSQLFMSDTFGMANTAYIFGSLWLVGLLKSHVFFVE